MVSEIFWTEVIGKLHERPPHTFKARSTVAPELCRKPQIGGAGIRKYCLGREFYLIDRSALKLENDERLLSFVKEEEHTVIPEDLQKVRLICSLPKTGRLSAITCYQP